jgi:hypothetical protein
MLRDAQGPVLPHTSEVPEIICLRIADGPPEYLRWVSENPPIQTPPLSSVAERYEIRGVESFRPRAQCKILRLTQ